MTHRGFSSLSMRIGGALLLAALLVIAVIAPIRSAKAQQTQLRRIVFPLVGGKPGYTVRVTAANIGTNPVNVEFIVLDARSNLAQLASSGPVPLPSRSTRLLEYMFTDNEIVLPVIVVQGTQSDLVTTVQIFDPAGAINNFLMPIEDVFS